MNFLKIQVGKELTLINLDQVSHVSITETIISIHLVKGILSPYTESQLGKEEFLKLKSALNPKPVTPRISRIG